MVACHQNPGSLDVDTMFYILRACCAVPRDRSVPERYNGMVFRICTDGTHAGYARLLDDDAQELRYFELRNFEATGSVTHGPAHLYNHATILKETMPSLNSLQYDTTMKTVLHFQDKVVAVHCPYWPAEASEWITRTRHHGCPSKSVIKQVVRYGCDFVGVAHKLSRNINGTNEWRLSFSKAELTIIRNWTLSQRIVYRTLWMINRIIHQRINQPPEQETVLCTYCFKTLMLWACEEQPPEFWTDSSLVESVSHMLKKLCQCLNLRICSNYFIPNNNMMDHLGESSI